MTTYRVLATVLGLLQLCGELCILRLGRLEPRLQLALLCLELPQENVVVNLYSEHTPRLP